MKTNTLLVLLLAASGAAHADLYKCKDATGKITYQDVGCDSAVVVKKLKRDLTVGDPAVIARSRAEVAEFQGRRALRLEAELNQAIAVEKAKEDAAKQWNDQQQARALGRLADATQDIANALNAPVITGKIVGSPMFPRYHKQHFNNRKY